MTTSYKQRQNESVEDLLGKSHYLVAKSQMDGNLTFDGHAKTVEELDNESRCRSLCAQIESALVTCREEEIPELLEMYDLLHRIGYGKMPDQRFLSTQRNRVYTAWRSGNSNIQESQIYSLLKKSVRENKTTDPIKTVKARILLTNMLKYWLRILAKNSCFPNVSTHENYQRLAHIMRENISKDLKLEWYYANKVEDFSSLSTQLLKSYRRFTNSLFPAVLPYESRQELDAVITKELASRFDLNTYEHKAFLQIYSY